MNPSLPVPAAPYGDTQPERLAEWAVGEGITIPAALPPKLVAKPLSALQTYSGSDPNELLRDRYLCRGGGMLFVGPTGVGKSSFAMQLIINWALQQAAFGLAPRTALKTLLVQAENDDGDLAEMRDGVFRGMELGPEEIEAACANILVAREDSSSGFNFILRLKALLEEHQPDLVCIDPVLAYLGGEVNSQHTVGEFLRNHLNPLLKTHNCACLVVHHTNKPPSGAERPNWQAGDHAYAGSGSAEWANWARAVLSLRSLGSHTVFELRAGKRGQRLGWVEEDGRTHTTVKYVAHHPDPRVICWREASADEVPAESQPKRQPQKEDVLIHVPPGEPISKNTLRNKANQADVPVNKINGFIDELVQDGLLYEWKLHRPGTRPEIHLSRSPQPDAKLL